MRVLLLLVIWAGAGALAQERPQWTYGYFEEVQNSYVEMVSGKGYDVGSARQKAMEVLYQRRDLSTGTTADMSFQNGNMTINQHGRLILKARVVDEYQEFGNGQYTVYLLVQTAKNPTLSYESVTVSDKYPFSARAFVPGMAQIYKGSTVKGVCFIASEAVLAGGVIATECLRQNYLRQINSTHTTVLKQKAAYNANACKITRDVCIGGLVAVYVWNVVDGAVAKGKKHVMIGNVAQMDIAPYVSNEHSGLAVRVEF